jgi:hypothetical protein
MRSYTVLRDLGTASTAEPFGGAAGPAEPGLGAVGLRIDVEQLDKGEVRALGRDPDVRAIAPVMPTSLIRPLEVTEPATTAWGITAVRADQSLRSGAGVVVAALDTGIDESHPASAACT